MEFHNLSPHTGFCVPRRIMPLVSFIVSFSSYSNKLFQDIVFEL